MTKYHPGAHEALKLIVQKSDAEKESLHDNEPIWLQEDFEEWSLNIKHVSLLYAMRLVEEAGVGLRLTHAGRIQLTRWNDGKDGADG